MKRREKKEKKEESKTPQGQGRTQRQGGKHKEGSKKGIYLSD